MKAARFTGWVPGAGGNANGGSRPGDTAPRVARAATGLTTVEEDELQRIERRIADAGSVELAAILFAALIRFAELGEPAESAMDRHLQMAGRIMPELRDQAWTAIGRLRDEGAPS